uniref:SnoaL-like domain-containing protein n=1 Tax=Chromera velia CCMP2878 TaxID=1169474 RepID=A0A0G4HJY2_9ALVE|eukprot:Cvel_28414.t1-p1 / transcript=Cvel_28414.t1 / gene=Cvel_28414 / organism=Chromera_velia_CCMP2878 / gene_product=hypothetical protein / transcript_product=hypothetical protein / location=Cvel_scaffold3714:12019-13732(-) / protein_length=422 / sequence_SO=supercontig / SO=protein_coding / is_pseudo=false
MDGNLTLAQASLQSAKAVVLSYQAALDSAFKSAKKTNSVTVSPETRLDAAVSALEKYSDPNLLWRGVHPFNVQHGPAAVMETFYKPLLSAFSALQRRKDIFLAGFSPEDGEVAQSLASSASVDTGAGSEGSASSAGSDVGEESVAGSGEGEGAPEGGRDQPVWVCSMGHFLGLFDAAFLGIPPTGRLCCVRYAEFSQVGDGRILQQCVHIDILSIMHQAGVYPLPAPTGAMMPFTPGPQTVDGILKEPQDERETEITLELLERMIADLCRCNKIAEETENRDQGCPPSLLAETWHEDMLWYGPAGIGSTGLTIPRYQRQHQMPFRENLCDKSFKGHVARFAEGKYEAWFGWPNLTNRALGGFMGLPGDRESEKAAEWRVVDIYRREGDKLAENWVFVDMLHYLKCRGLDVLKRMNELQRLGD